MLISYVSDHLVSKQQALLLPLLQFPLPQVLFLLSLCTGQAFHCCTGSRMPCDRPDLLKMITEPSPDTYVLLNMDASTVLSADPGNT